MSGSQMPVGPGIPAQLLRGWRQHSAPPVLPSPSSLSLMEYLYAALPFHSKGLSNLFFSVTTKGLCQSCSPSINTKPRVYFIEMYSGVPSLKSFSMMWAWFAYKHISRPFLPLVIFKASLLGSIAYIVWLIVGTEIYFVNMHMYRVPPMCQALGSLALWNIHSMNSILTNEGHKNLIWISISMANY